MCSCRISDLHVLLGLVEFWLCRLVVGRPGRALFWQLFRRRLGPSPTIFCVTLSSAQESIILGREQGVVPSGHSPPSRRCMPAMDPSTESHSVGQLTGSTMREMGLLAWWNRSPRGPSTPAAGMSISHSSASSSS